MVGEAPTRSNKTREWPAQIELVGQGGAGFDELVDGFHRLGACGA